MPEVRFEPTIPAFERAKTVHASDPSAIVTGFPYFYRVYLFDIPSIPVRWKSLLKYIWFIYRFINTPDMFLSLETPPS
jgi:hypothetical protein